MSELIIHPMPLEPFDVPKHVRGKCSRQDVAVYSVPSFHISELPAVTLAKLCDQFRRDVFREAGKEYPSKATP